MTRTTHLLAEAATGHTYNPYLFGLAAFATFLVLLLITFSLRRDR